MSVSDMIVLLIALFVLAIVAYFVWRWMRKNKKKEEEEEDEFPDPSEQDVWVYADFTAPGVCGYGGEVGDTVPLRTKGWVCSVNRVYQVANIYWTDLWNMETGQKWNREDRDRAYPGWGVERLGDCTTNPQKDYYACGDGETDCTIRSVFVPLSDLVIVDEYYSP